MEVDRNVTRHLPDAIRKDDWDTVILHYLGLDHIGHLEGPSSSLMPAKQKEMDHVVELIYRELVEKDKKDGKKSLFLVCGDHGMTEGGNHGGSSFNEVSTAAVFLSPLFSSFKQETDESIHYLREINQIDIVPTLSVLFSLPVPINNSGKIIQELVSNDLYNSYFINAYQMYRLFDRSFQIDKQQSSSANCQIDAGDKTGSMSCLKALYQASIESVDNSDIALINFQKVLDEYYF